MNQYYYGAKCGALSRTRGLCPIRIRGGGRNIIAKRETRKPVPNEAQEMLRRKRLPPWQVVEVHIVIFAVRGRDMFPKRGGVGSMVREASSEQGI